MREIFRGKRFDNGEWVEGSAVWFDEDQCFIMPPYPGASSLSYAQLFALTAVMVDPATVGQYTDMTDKSKKRIWQGDIIKCWSEGVCARGEVKQRKDGLWIIYPAWQKSIMWGLCPDEYGRTMVEVIGNIHDNPEFLEGGD